MDSETGNAATSWPVALLGLSLLIVMLVLTVQAALKPPSGEGVPGPGEWARRQQHEQSHPGVVN